MGQILLTNYPREGPYYKVVLKQRTTSIFNEVASINKWAENFHRDILVEIQNYNPYNEIGYRGKLVLYFENEDEVIFFKLSWV